MAVIAWNGHLSKSGQRIDTSVSEELPVSSEKESKKLI